MRGSGTPQGNMMKLSTFVEPLNIIIHANFHVCLMISLQASGGQKRDFPVEMHMALTT
jgi:hypothetical protein